MSEYRVTHVSDRHEVSDTGEVRSLGQRPGVMRQRPNRDGYASVHIAGSTRRVAVLVAHAFLGPPPPGLILRHLNDDRMDSNLTNLVWGTHSDNAQDRVRNGKDAHARRTHCDSGHEYTDLNTRVTARGRECRACARDKATARRRLLNPTPMTPSEKGRAGALARWGA